MTSRSSCAGSCTGTCAACSTHRRRPASTSRPPWSSWTSPRSTRRLRSVSSWRARRRGCRPRWHVRRPGPTRRHHRHGWRTRTILLGGRRGVGDPVEPRGGALAAVVVEALAGLRGVQRRGAAPRVGPPLGRRLRFRAGGAGPGPAGGLRDPCRLCAVAGRARGGDGAPVALEHRDRPAPAAPAGHRALEGGPALLPRAAPSQRHGAARSSTPTRPCRRGRRRRGGRCRGWWPRSCRSRSAARWWPGSPRRTRSVSGGARDPVGAGAGVAHAGLGGATCGRCSSRTARAPPGRLVLGRHARRGPRRHRWRPSGHSPSSSSGRPRAARRRGWPCRPSSVGAVRWWPPA